AWQDTWFQLQSDVTVAVAKALREAGIEIPFPQRDLHIRSIGASAAENLPNNDVRIASPSDLTARGTVRYPVSGGSFGIAQYSRHFPKEAARGFYLEFSG